MLIDSIRSLVKFLALKFIGRNHTNWFESNEVYRVVKEKYYQKKYLL
jgi:hypothetical protein